MENMSCDPSGDLGQGGLVSVDEILTLNPADFLNTLPDISSESSSGVLSDAMATVTPLEDVSMATPPSDITMTSDNVTSGDITMTSQSPDVSMETQMSTITDMSLEPAMVSLLSHISDTSSTCVAMTTSDMPPTCVAMATSESSSVNVSASIAAGPSESSVTIDASTKSPTASDVSDSTTRGDMSVSTPITLTASLETGEDTKSLITGATPVIKVDPPFVTDAAEDGAALPSDTDKSVSSDAALNTLSDSVVSSQSVSSADTVKAPVSVVDTTTDNVVTSDVSHLVDTNPALDDTTAGETTSPTGETTSLTSQTTSPTGETTSPTSQTTSPIGETTSPTGETTSPTGETTSPAGEATGVTNEAEASVWKTTTTQSETIGKSETTTTDCTITPAAHETITAECESAPAECKSAPAECKSAVAECESAPAEWKSATAECESVAAESETSTTDSVATPAECESAPAKCETTPAGCETTPADSETMPAESETTPAESEIITAKCDIAADKCETTPDKCETTPDKCETIPDKCEMNTDKSESTSDKCETTTATSANPPEDETVKKGDETSGVNIPESTSTPVDIAVGDSLAVSHSGSISAVTDGSSVPVMPGGSTEVTAAIASSITTVSLSTPVSPRDVLSPGRAAVAADGSIITLSSNFSLPVSFGAAGTVTTTQSHLPPGVAPVMFPTSLPGGSTSGMSQQFAGAINLTITNGSVSVKPKHDSAPPAATPPVATPTAAPLPTAIRYTNLGMPTLISTMPSSMKLPPNLCLAAPRATTSLSGQLPISSTFVNGTTMMIRPAPPAARFSNQMALVQSAGTKMRAPFITPGTVLPPGAKLLAHVPAQFVPMVTSMPRGKAPSGGVLTSTSATVATSLTDATLWMASMQPVLPAGTAGSETLATSNKSTVGVSSAPPGGNVVTSTLVTEGAMKQPTIRSRTDAELSASSPDKVTERKDSATEGSSDFDPVSAMEWKDGVGNLPGSDLKFKLNEFGVIEMVTEEDEMDTKVSMEAHDGDGSHQGTDMTDAQEMAADTNGICRCENCGVYGMISEFCNGGRFCSKSCVGSFASKKCMMKHVKSSHDREKKKKRKLSLPEDHRELKVVKVAPDKDDLNGNTTKIIITHVPKKTRGFHWAQYLDQENAVATPVKMFKDAFPCTKNGFKVGMKLEGIDPRHPQLYTVLSVAEVKGFRLRLHFDGYSECYDFWVSANNPFLFPAGWAEKNGKTLQPPKGYTTETFNWATYLKSSRFPAAPKHLFTNTQAASVTPHGFRVGMKLEAVDKKHTYLTCVATVADVLGDRILIHFDGWEDNYDYWCDPSSPYIHPMGWCQESGKPLSPPNDWKDIDGFTWEDYLARTNTQAVAARAFKMRPANQFEVGMKLEAVDQRNPLLVRVATVSDTETHRLKIHFDGWSAAYDYWVDDDSPDIHPVGWCSKTMHPLTPTVSGTESSSQSGCPTPGCSGVGHVKGAKYTGHHSSFGCPYSAANMNKEMILQDRVGPTRSDSFDGSSLNVAPSPERIFRKCPTHGCDGSGHVTGKYTAHHRQSGCPLVDKYVPPSVPAKSAPTTPLALLNGGKPLFGPGSGRGRKKTKLLKLIQKEKELQAQGKVSSHNYRDSSHVIKKEESQSDVDAECVLRESIHQSVFMSSMLPSPSKDLPLCWEQHSKLLPGVDQHCAADVTEWSTEKVAGFIGTLPGCEELADVFQEEQIDGEAFLLLTQTDIVKIMNIKLGPALKIYNSILIFKNNDNTV